MSRITSLRDGLVATAVIDNEDRLNALNLRMWVELRRTFEALRAERDLRCIVVQGAGGKAFSAGADISEFREARSNLEQVTKYHEEIVGPALAAMMECDVPIIAKIRGACMGGGLEIAVASDIRIADPNSRFGVAVGQLGFPLAFGETQVLFNLVGPSVAAELLIEGRILSAHEALARGLITRTSEPGGLEMAVEQTVQNILRSGRSAARSHKRQLRRLSRDPAPVSVVERMEVYAFADTDEYRNGYEAFLARREVKYPAADSEIT